MSDMFFRTTCQTSGDDVDEEFAQALGLIRGDARKAADESNAACPEHSATSANAPAQKQAPSPKYVCTTPLAAATS